ncbi:GntR family transcriptional regulator [Ornithinibacillus sp. BX22]|uniref:GntR family transcriptional regulator n=2 Tax=Ornithinibacillus TaxID=484508 RepID=A0A923L777_9BACI|nr:MULTISPECIES: GntR family transcriptional regulator [Ornithinibacillus]MBC5637689.1 GntR family transcriptional regulator [Ornithinibacillus hominis]MBS3681635.1 GntR family transcriptional regulator [Ornithinibacillus massiliensis]
MNLIISSSNKDPLFLQIKEQIKQQIFSGDLKEGDALPSMRSLAKDLKVSVITTKRAYEELEKEGFLVSTVGKGTFVAGQQPHVLREWQIRELENELEKLVIASKQLGLSKEELLEMLNIYYEEESR